MSHLVNLAGQLLPCFQLLTPPPPHASKRQEASLVHTRRNELSSSCQAKTRGIASIDSPSQTGSAFTGTPRVARFASCEEHPVEFHRSGFIAKVLLEKDL